MGEEMDFYLKDPEAAISYAIDWGAAYLGPLAIAQSDWEIEPAEADGLTIQSHSHDFRSTAALVAGGVEGHVYRLANRVILSEGSSDVRSIVLRVERR